MTFVKTPSSRIEHDFLGEKEISNAHYFGVQTARAVENFYITGIPISNEPLFIQAFAWVKKAAARANRDCGILDLNICFAIEAACDRLAWGEFLDQFPTDMIQGGAGTSCNMNVNEVIANIAIESLGGVKGEYSLVHPNNHVNCSQSTNDAYPTAFRMALYEKIKLYISELEKLANAFEAKGIEFTRVLKMGRT